MLVAHRPIWDLLSHLRALCFRMPHVLEVPSISLLPLKPMVWLSGPLPLCMTSGILGF